MFCREIQELARLGIKALQKYLGESPSSLTLTIGGKPMANEQITVGDSIVVTITDTDDITNAVVTPDAGSVLASLSPNASSSTVVVDPSGAFATITAGPTPATGDSINVTATVGDIASKSASALFDVIEGPAPDPTSLSLTFGTETVDTTTEGDNAGLVFNETTGNWEPPATTTA